MTPNAHARLCAARHLRLLRREHGAAVALEYLRTRGPALRHVPRYSTSPYARRLRRERGAA